jgi:hypothetical protein
VDALGDRVENAPSSTNDRIRLAGWSTITRIAHALEADVRFIGRPSSRIEDVDPR